MAHNATFLIAIDGASKGNPGPAGIGALITDPDGVVVAEIARSIGIATCNVAEYRALIAGLEEALVLGARNVRVQTDSELLTYQIQGLYKVSAPRLRKLYDTVAQLISRFETFDIRHTSRAWNTRADALANRGVASGGTDRKKIVHTELLLMHSMS